MPRAHRLRAGVYFYWFARCCPVAWRLAAMLQLLGRYSRPLVECAPMHLNCVGVGVGVRGRAWDSLGLRGVAAGVGACRGGPRPHGTGKHPGALVSLPTPPGGKCTRGASRVLHLTHLSVRRSFSVSREVHVHEKYTGITGKWRPRLPYCRRRSHSLTSGGNSRHGHHEFVLRGRTRTLLLLDFSLDSSVLQIAAFRFTVENHDCRITRSPDMV